jgi:glutaredoxin
VSSTIVLYGREGCCLCDDARTMLLRAREQFAFELVERDIEADDELLRKFLERIPVIEIDGVERFELVIDEPELLAALARLQSSAPYQ